MKLPWVSRDVHEALDAHHLSVRGILFAEIAEVSGRLAVEHQRHDALLEKYQSLLDRVLPVPSSPVMATAGREPRDPDPIQQAIRDESAGDSRLAAHLRKRANELLTEKKTREEVAQELRTWQTTATEGVTAP